MLDPDWLYTELIPEAQFYLLLPFAASPWTSTLPEFLLPGEGDL